MLRRVLREEVEPIVDSLLAAALERAIALWLEPIHDQLEEVRDELARRSGEGDGGMATAEEVDRFMSLFKANPGLLAQLPSRRRDYLRRRLLREGRTPRKATVAEIEAELGIDLGADDGGSAA
jgi:hypothetical protein